MSKTCQESTPAICGLPAMTQHAGRWMCFTCREQLEQAPARKRIQRTPQEVEADRQKLLGEIWDRKP